MLLTEVEIQKILSAKQLGRIPSSHSPALLQQDSRKITKNDLFICVKGEKADGHDFIPQVIQQGASVIIGTDASKISAASIHHPSTLFFLVDDIQAATQKLAHASRMKRDIPVIALTGASGKTTTKDLLVHILSLKHSVLFTPENNNNLWGVPLALVNISERHSVCVLETGTNAPGEVHKLAEIVEPNATYTTSIGESHLEFLKDLDGVLRAETEQYHWMASHAKKPFFFINLSDPQIKKFYESQKEILRTKGSLITLSSDLNSPADFCIQSITPLGFEDKFGTAFTIKTPQGIFESRISIPGIHNVANALAAFTIAVSLNLISPEDAAAKLPTATITGLRSEIFKTSSHAIIYNDSYNANPSSMRASMRAAQLIAANPQARIKRTIAVLGDMKEMGPTSEVLHEQTGRAAKDSGFNLLFTCGEFASAWKRGFGDQAKTFLSSEEIIHALTQELKEGDLVLIKASHSARFDLIARALSKL